jgi:hypothetical protein
MVGGAPRCSRIDALKTQCTQVELIDENVESQAFSHSLDPLLPFMQDNNGSSVEKVGFSVRQNSGMTSTRSVGAINLN